MPIPYSTAPQHAPLTRNPIRGWRAVGAWLLDHSLWTENYAHNPLVTYFTGRRKGWLADDALSFFPWIVAAAVNGYLLYLIIDNVKTEFYVYLLFAELVFLPVYTATFTAVLVERNFRYLVQRLPFEEILLTFISKREIVHAISIRPMATQSAALIFMAMGQMLLLIPAYQVPGRRASNLDYFLAVAAIIIGYYVAGKVSETAGALALRSHLYIRHELLAKARFVRDFLLSKLGIPMALVFLLNWFFIYFGGVFGVFLCGMMALIVTSNDFDADARGILRDCSEQSEHWWVFRVRDRVQLKVNWMTAPWEKIFDKLGKGQKAKSKGQKSVFVR